MSFYGMLVSLLNAFCNSKLYGLFIIKFSAISRLLHLWPRQLNRRTKAGELLRKRMITYKLPRQLNRRTKAGEPLRKSMITHKLKMASSHGVSTGGVETVVLFDFSAIQGAVYIFSWYLSQQQVISNASAHHASVISGKTKVHPVISFKKCNPPDFKFYLSKLTNKVFIITKKKFPHMVKC